MVLECERVFVVMKEHRTVCRCKGRISCFIWVCIVEVCGTYLL